MLISFTILFILLVCGLFIDVILNLIQDPLIGNFFTRLDAGSKSGMTN